MCLDIRFNYDKKNIFLVLFLFVYQTGECIHHFQDKGGKELQDQKWGFPCFRRLLNNNNKMSNSKSCDEGAEERFLLAKN